MKQYFLIQVISLLLFSVNESSAQKSIEIGIKGGLSVPDLASVNDAYPISTGYDSRLDVDAAVQLEFHLSRHFSIQPELEYCAQGGKKDGNQAFAVPAGLVAEFPGGEVPAYAYANYKSIAKINYLMFPVLAKYGFGLGRRWGAYVAGGPFVSILLSAKNVTSGMSNIYVDQQQTQPVTTTPQSFNDKDNIKSDLHNANAGISGNAGVNYRLINGSIFFEIGGNYGLIDIQKDGNDGKNKIGAGVINIGYQFRL